MNSLEVQIGDVEGVNLVQNNSINSLESAIYNLVEPFEDKVRDLETEYDDLEWDIEEAGEDRAA